MSLQPQLRERGDQTPLKAGTVVARPFEVRVIPSPPALTTPAVPPGKAPARPVEVLPPSGLVTPRLVLRALAPADHTAFTDLLARSRDSLQGRINVHGPGEPDAAVFARLLAATELGMARATQWRCAAFLPAGQPVGMVHILGIERGMQFRGDAGWWVGPFHTGNGVATEMVAAMVRHAFRDIPDGLGLHTLTAAIAPDNGASRRVAEKAGFRRVPGALTSVAIGGVHESHEVWELHAAI